MGKAEVVVDTNVPLVANGKAEQAGWKCEDACVRKLIQVQAGRRTLVDDKRLIFKEYLKRLSLSGQPGLGDAFFKWLWENQANPQHCRIVPVTVHDGRSDSRSSRTSARLDSFDRSDRKFVAVALASGSSPKVLNAADTDWRDHRQALAENGVDVVFLCPELMERER